MKNFGNSNKGKNPSVKEVLDKYSGKIENQMNNSSNSNLENSQEYSGSYRKFKNEMSPQFSRYEKWCHSLGSFVKMNISEEKEKKIQRFLNIAHLDIEPWQSYTLSVLGFLAIFMLGLIISFSIMLIRGGFEGFPFMFFFLSIVFSVFLFYYLNGISERLANKWRLKASSQMVPAILYIVVYMRHTPNLEKAISFAAQHLEEPLALDLKKVFYDVEIGKFSTIKESLDNYLNIWKDYSSEFIESFHLIESSLFEPDENRRIATLEKSLQVVLDGVYDNMLKFVHEVKAPLQNTYMLGTTLPVLGLALLPLASAMIGEHLQSSHVFVLYNLLIPFIAFFLMNKFLLMRPGGYGETNLLERNRHYDKYKSKKPYWKALLICFPLLLIGVLPLIFGYTPVPEWLGIERDYTFGNIGLSFIAEEQIFGFISTGFGNTGVRGPYGIGALIMGMFLPLGIALYFSLVFKFKTRELIKERNSTKKLESEFNNSLFQLGSRIGNGTPPELVFSRAMESSQGLKTEDFFKRVNYNIRQLGMNVERAIFDKKRGAINYYPSNLIATSMRILIESSKKGLKIASTSLMSISQYVKNIRKITERLKDMLAEVVSDMKSNMTFLAPLLSGIVVGLASMITAILLKLEGLMSSAGSGGGFGGASTLLNIFKAEQMIPPYFLQLAIGIYLIQIVFILTSSLVTIDNGEDRLTRTYEISKNLKTGILFYFVTAFIASLILFGLASVVLGGL